MMADKTQILRNIVVDYSPENCTHKPESNEIMITYDSEGGSCWHSKTRFMYGTFGAKIKCPNGNTSGLNFNIYLSSLEGSKDQDEIDFEILGKNRRVIETDYHVKGKDIGAVSHDLGFDCSDGFHNYVIKWEPNMIEWLIDDKLVRRVEKKSGKGFPDKPMFLYASLWNATKIDKGRWAGHYVGCDEPYICHYKDVFVPADTAVLEDYSLFSFSSSSSSSRYVS